MPKKSATKPKPKPNMPTPKIPKRMMEMKAVVMGKAMKVEKGRKKGK